jgi:hypothetical protein
LERISFNGGLNAVRHFANGIHAACGKPRRQSRLHDELPPMVASDPARENDQSSVNDSPNRTIRSALSPAETAIAPTTKG